LDCEKAVDVTSDSRFDQNLAKFATAWLLDIARDRSLKSVLEKLLTAGLGNRSADPYLPNPGGQ
jgi:hypothetical protein